MKNLICILISATLFVFATSAHAQWVQSGTGTVASIHPVGVWSEVRFEGFEPLNNQGCSFADRGFAVIHDEENNLSPLNAEFTTALLFAGLHNSTAEFTVWESTEACFANRPVLRIIRAFGDAQ